MEWSVVWVSPALLPSHAAELALCLARSPSGAALLHARVCYADLLPAAVVLAALAFLALRPRRGWLRRRQAQPAAGSEASKLADEPASKASLDPSGPSSLPSHPPEVVVGLPSRLSDSAYAAQSAVGALAPAAARSVNLLSAERLAALRALSESGPGPSPNA